MSSFSLSIITFSFDRILVLLSASLDSLVLNLHWFVSFFCPIHALLVFELNNFRSEIVFYLIAFNRLIYQIFTLGLLNLYCIRNITVWWPDKRRKGSLEFCVLISSNFRRYRSLNFISLFKSNFFVRTISLNLKLPILKTLKLIRLLRVVIFWLLCIIVVYIVFNFTTNRGVINILLLVLWLRNSKLIRNFYRLMAFSHIIFQIDLILFRSQKVLNRVNAFREVALIANKLLFALKFERRCIFWPII